MLYSQFLFISKCDIFSSSEITTFYELPFLVEIVTMNKCTNLEMKYNKIISLLKLIILFLEISSLSLKELHFYFIVLPLSDIISWLAKLSLPIILVCQCFLIK